jgi:hypothetical protein
LSCLFCNANNEEGVSLDVRAARFSKTKRSPTMKNVLFGIVACLAILPAGGVLGEINGHGDYETGDYGYYYMLTGGKFPNGQTCNGDNASGGTIRYLTDDTYWGNYPQGVWNKDDWFTQNSGFALTMKSGGSIVYDNNGIETGQTDGFYNESTNANLAGLYRGYSMSNNYDWIYAGYFKLTEATTIDTLIGYFDAGSMPNPENVPGFRMNIWSSIVSGNGLIPAVNSMAGDVFSTDSAAGAFSWSDTGEDRYLSSWAAPHTRDIMRLQFTLSQPITLQPGEYFFGHDAVVPEPGTLALLGMGGLGLLAYAWRRRS